MASTINIKKEEILLKTFIRKTDIQVLMDTTKWSDIQEVFQEAREQVLSNGKKLFHKDKVPKSVVVKILGIDEKEIHRNAALERQIKKDVSS